MSVNDQKLWFPYAKQRPAGKLRLFCFPYAGGGAGIYRTWAHLLPSYIDVFAAQLPGRETRTREQPFTRMAHLIEAITPVIHTLADQPFAFFGHSMGTMIAWELACEMKRRYGREPVHLFVAGRRAPHVPETSPPIHNLPEPQFMDELIRYNGLPEEVMEHVELMEFKEPLLRADFELCETYSCQPDFRLSCPITAFGGLEDPDETRELLEPWRELTTRFCKVHMLPGDHFFLKTSEQRLIQMLSEELRRIALWAAPR